MTLKTKLAKDMDLSKARLRGLKSRHSRLMGEIIEAGRKQDPDKVAKLNEKLWRTEENIKSEQTRFEYLRDRVNGQMGLNFYPLEKF